MPHFDPTLIENVRSHPDSEELLPGAMPASLTSVESSIAHKLPSSFKEFLTQINGGVMGSIRLFGVARGDYFDLAEKQNEYGAFIPPIKAGMMIPFASDWGGGLYCFDTYHPSQDGEYPIWYWNHEYSEEPADAPYVWSQIETDFAAFMRAQFTNENDG
ncbi:MAG: hypothetical protein B0A82_05060 [Alkalinema sp. CACIAM 70d]|nr:MAG: hypothetical protein B0A82_05060 [Alkalinema sp. CACIAM 70d]